MTGLAAHSTVAIRLAGSSDGSELRRVAELDSATVPGGTLLLAEVDGTLLAAVALDDGHVIADAFAPTADLVALLRARATQLRRTARSGEESGGWARSVLHAALARHVGWGRRPPCRLRDAFVAFARLPVSGAPRQL